MVEKCVYFFEKLKLWKVFLIVFSFATATGFLIQIARRPVDLFDMIFYMSMGVLMGLLAVAFVGMERKDLKDTGMTRLKEILNKDELEILHRIAQKMHPHLGEDNHTSTLINKVANQERLSSKDIFDLGKYYDRMLLYVDHSKDDSDEFLDRIEEFLKADAILSLKTAVYSYNS